MEQQQVIKYLKEADFVAIYRIGPGVLARVPTSIPLRAPQHVCNRSIWDRGQVAQAEAVELAEWCGVEVMATYWNMNHSEEIDFTLMPPEQYAELTRCTVLDFFSMQEVKDFLNA